MGNKPAKKEGTYPVLSGKMEGMQDVLAKNLGGEASDVSAFDLPRIQMPTAGGDKWTLPDGDSVKTLEGIIVAWQDVRAYWPDSEAMGNPPQCQSPDARVGYGEPGGECKKCPMAEYGSAESGAGQACKKMKRLFLLLEDDMLPTLVTLPPTSLKPCRQYFMALIQSQTAYDALVTKIGLDSDQNANGVEYSKAIFEQGTRLTEEQQEAVEAYRDSISGLLETRVTAADYGDAEGEEL